ncbi:hypothetical protein BS78_04G136300 [Paspalum vaginatum]|nr:hypothetical protein BS78_04G136300 [Paspalum vaginatum]
MEAVVRQQETAKRPRVEAAAVTGGNEMGAFEVLPQELVMSVLAAVSSRVDKPADLFNAMLVCKKFSELGMNPPVLKVASVACLSVRFSKWCAAEERFLLRCGDSGNAEANYLLGMIQFYCLRQRQRGWSRMMMAVRSRHAEATFAVAVIRLNGAGTDFESRDPSAAAHLFALAANRGHVGALRDLAFCISNGLGVPQNPSVGRSLTICANIKELLDRYPEGSELDGALAHIRIGNNPDCCLLSNLGCFAAVSTYHEWPHPANRFLAEWFAAQPQAPPPAPLQLMCSFPTCGRPETRPLEFRRCTMCAIARYCSRMCQSLHWRMGHKQECVPVYQWILAASANAAANNNIGAPM